MEFGWIPLGNHQFREYFHCDQLGYNSNNFIMKHDCTICKELSQWPSNNFLCYKCKRNKHEPVPPCLLHFSRVEEVLIPVIYQGIANSLYLHRSTYIIISCIYPISQSTKSIISMLPVYYFPLKLWHVHVLAHIKTCSGLQLKFGKSIYKQPRHLLACSLYRKS